MEEGLLVRTIFRSLFFHWPLSGIFSADALACSLLLLLNVLFCAYYFIMTFFMVCALWQLTLMTV